MKRSRDGFGAAGWAAVILASSLGIGWMGGLLIASIADAPITDAGAALLNGIGQVLAGAVATFLGSQIIPRHMRAEEEEAAETAPKDPAANTPPPTERTDSDV